LPAVNDIVSCHAAGVVSVKMWAALVMAHLIR
jgi:hypothetical protein